MPRPYTKLREELIDGIKSGQYLIGTLIEPKRFTKHIIDKNGEIKETEYQVCGRKIPLNTIRERMLKHHQQLGIMRNLPKIKRHLVFWADHSCILNTGYLLFTVRLIYNEEIYFTDKEIFQQKGLVYDVQEIVESPQIYILGQSDDSLSDKLTYTDSRLEDVENIIPLTTENGIVEDEVRFFIGS